MTNKSVAKNGVNDKANSRAEVLFPKMVMLSYTSEKIIPTGRNFYARANFICRPKKKRR